MGEAEDKRQRLRGRTVLFYVCSLLGLGLGLGLWLWGTLLSNYLQGRLGQTSKERKETQRAH